MTGYAAIAGGPLFSDLVRQRERELWIDPHPGIHSRSVCRNEPPPAAFDLAGWHCCPFWQRKLDNKLNAKVFAGRLGLAVAALYWQGKDPAGIPFRDLPNEYVIKTSTGWNSQQVVPVAQGTNIFTRRAQSPDDLVKHFKQIMAREPYASGSILVEELLQSTDGEHVPRDYKCWVFSGNVEFIKVVDRLKGRYRWYRPDWQSVPDQMHLGGYRGQPEPAPVHLAEIVRWAELLGRAYEYPFVRIDLYDTPNGVVFGEFTPTPMTQSARLLYTPYANRTIGRLWAHGLRESMARAGVPASS